MKQLVQNETIFTNPNEKQRGRISSFSNLASEKKIVDTRILSTCFITYRYLVLDWIINVDYKHQ